MLWIHGGACSGSGSSWLYDGGALVLKSVSIDKPVIVVTINYRLGLFGSASSVQIREDNRSAGDDGAGNYGLYDQQVALSWVRSHIAAFGGDPDNITLFGEGTGAADVLCHMQSAANHAAPQFARAIAQSPLGAPDEATTVQNAGWMLSRLMSSLGVHDVAAMRALDAKTLVSLSAKYPVRMVDDGVFFHPSVLSSNPKPAPQPLLIGDNSFTPVVYTNELMRWVPGQLIKRVHAIIQSKKQSNALLRAYDISACTPEIELADRLLELVGDARWAYPTERAASVQSNGTSSVFRYVWDQEPHEAADGNIPVDVAFLFDTVPVPTSTEDSPFDTDVFDEDLDDLELEELESSQSSLRSNSSTSSSFSLWTAPPPVDRYCYAHVRDAVQERWLSYAAGEEPWEPERVYVFGPEGDCGARSRAVFTGRRRTRVWEEALAPLGAELVMKLGAELANGPSSSS
jgi:carboxylesterase type B